MSSRTVKWLLLASVLLIAFPVVAGASTARVAGLGIQGDYIKDYTNVYTYLSNISSVGNVVYGELGNVNYPGDWYYNKDQAVGVIIGNLFDGKFGTIGVHLREATPQLGQGDASAPVGTDAEDPNSNYSHSFDLMWGKKIGSLAVGLRMNRSYAKQTGDPSIWGNEWTSVAGDDSYYYTEDGLDLAYHQNVTGFGGGLAFEVSPKLSLEGSFLYQSRSFEAADSTPNPLRYQRENWWNYRDWDNDGYNEEIYGLDPNYPFSEGLNNHLYSLGTWKNDGGGAYQLALRGLWQWQPNVLVVPVFKYYKFSQKVQHDYKYETTNPYDHIYFPSEGDTLADSLREFASVTETPLDITRSGWQLGLAGNWTLNQNDLLVLGATVSSFSVKDIGNDPYNVIVDGVVGDSTSEDPADWVASVPSHQYFADSKYDYKYTTTVMPLVFAALETHVNSWLTLRFGAQQGVFYTTKYVNNMPRERAPLSEDWNAERTKEVTTKFSPFQMMLGAGFKFGNLQLDATLNPDFIHNGPYFISGQTTGYDAYDYDGSTLFPKVTATYTF
jgi:hypothetical protein